MRWLVNLDNKGDTSILKIDNLGFRYGDATILKDLSLHIQGSGLYALHGESGSGKTTFINIIALIQKPSAGKMTLFNQSIDFTNQEQVDEYRKKIAYFFQDLNLIESLTVRENLHVISLINEQEISNERLAEQAKKLKMSEKLDVTVSNLSGGERQRAAFLKIMLFDYSLILLDEPTNNLDKDNIQMMLGMLSELKKTRTILVVTHSDIVVQQADVVLRFEDLNKRNQSI
ncbi:ABC transporter ATP-binding protein [Bacillus xiamenensis]|uniref:ABC transporter ATP-binding protein n=1 Tax=Bacillus xiamenensis TaxID=1178537 RepID=A0AAC9NBP2_9BACI|nr:ABC transporter ATP-binding protein [Bacillus xiamenensis]QGX64256.1 ATP-binding cassette domain-containing protein [Bacillus sp. ms-22]